MGVGKSGSTGEGKSGLDSFSSYMGDGKRQARRREGETETDGQTPNCTGGGQAPGRPGLKGGRKDRQGQTGRDWDRDRRTDPELHRWWPSTRQARSEGRSE